MEKEKTGWSTPPILAVGGTRRKAGKTALV
jgi:hypothetical protein